MVVVSSGGWIQNASLPTGQNTCNLSQNTTQNNKMTAKGILICRDNSHPFQERTLTLEQPVKIGRSVARARAAPNNAIFDCKVLSRNHASLWYSSGKFYLQDTCSSNGTFVNNQRLSASGLESTPKEVCSGDIVQFGVDVVESTKKVTHGCIVATLKLYLPDGKEAKASLSTSVISPAGNVTLEDLYKLNQVMQEASRREKALYSKLGYLQQLVENTRKAANQSWKALITEDRLLSWVVTVESQLAVYSKNFTEDKIRNELAKLQDEKAQYQNAAKEALQKILQEKLEVTQRLVQLEGRLSETEEECQSLHNVAKYTQTELQELSAKYAEAQKKLQETTDKLMENEERAKDALLGAEQEKRDLSKRLDDQSKVEKNLRARLRDSRLDSVNIYKQITALRNYTQTLQDMHLKLEVGENFDSKAEEDPIEAINIILNKLNSIRVDNVDVESEMNYYSTKSEQDHQNNPPIADHCVDSIQLRFTNSDLSFSKDQSDDSRTTEYILPPSSPLPLCGKTLVNGNADIDNSDSNADSDTNSEATDETYSITASDDAIDKSIVENKREADEEDEEEEEEEEDEDEDEEDEEAATRETIFQPNSVTPRCTMEVRFAIAENIQHVASQVRCESAEDDNAAAAVVVALSETLVAEEISNEPINISDRNRRYEANQVVPVGNECEERSEEDYLNTLKPVVIKNDTTQQTLHSREYILRTLVGSLDSLRSEDNLEAQRIIKRELDELKDWLIREPSELVIDQLKELYRRAKNEVQRMQEINEELVIVKEKYNVFVEEKAELSKKYMSLKAQCGDLLNATYTVPIHYVAPIAIMLIWMLLEKLF